MEKEFVTYEQALALKELGFNEDTICVYDSHKRLKSVVTHSNDGDNIVIDKWESRLRAPLKQQVFRWFREKYDLTGLIHIGSQEFSYSVNKDGHRITPLKDYIEYNGTYEEAENTCIDKLIKIVKQQYK